MADTDTDIPDEHEMYSCCGYSFIFHFKKTPLSSASHEPDLHPTERKVTLFHTFEDFAFY